MHPYGLLDCLLVCSLTSHRFALVCFVFANSFPLISMMIMPHFVPEEYNFAHIAQLKRAVFRFISLVSSSSIQRLNWMDFFCLRVTLNYATTSFSSLSLSFSSLYHLFGFFFFLIFSFCVPLFAFVYLRALNVIWSMIVLLSLQMNFVLVLATFYFSSVAVVAISKQHFNSALLNNVLVDELA